MDRLFVFCYFEFIPFPIFTCKDVKNFKQNKISEHVHVKKFLVRYDIDTLGINIHILVDQ